MKKGILFFTLLLTTLVFYSCDKSDFEYENDFNKSHKTWLSFKEQSNNSYVYTTSGGTWVGASWETTITVENGGITQRKFKYTRIEEGLTPPAVLEWTENKDQINTHKDDPASEAMTLDDVYVKAKEDWLKKQKDTKAFFEAKNAGMISLCGYSPDNCADDCFRGISIKEIKSLK